MPYSFCVELALTEGFSLDWLILGQERGGMDVHAAFLAFTQIQRMPRSSSIDFERVDAAEITEPFAAAYDRILTLLDNEMEKGRSREEAATYIGEVMKVLLQAPVSSDFELAGTNLGRGSNRQERNPVPSIAKAGPEHIPLEQARALQELVREAADYQIASGMEEFEAMAYAQKPLNRRFAVPHYRLLPKELGDDAIAWMTQRLARLRLRLTGADYVPWRTELYIAIYRQARKLRYSKTKLFAIALDLFDKRLTTLKQLDDQELRTLHNVIASTER